MRGHPREVGVRRRQILDAQRTQPGFGFVGVVQTRAKAVNVDHDGGAWA
jgi:hypothetical protein